MTEQEPPLQFLGIEHVLADIDRALSWTMPEYTEPEERTDYIDTEVDE